MSSVVKVGLGRSKSGKILDAQTHWYNFQVMNEVESAIQYHLETGKPLFVSLNDRAYREVTIGQLKRLAESIKQD